mmetsp:Transcript_1156/g.2531  ORF Transcript_1156/g.2531 Transcript_1156/m.2531 type:complete len:84 (+) Transcript_1156:380-631(+)
MVRLKFGELGMPNKDIHDLFASRSLKQFHRRASFIIPSKRVCACRQQCLDHLQRTVWRDHMQKGGTRSSKGRTSNAFILIQDG